MDMNTKSTIRCNGLVSLLAWSCISLSANAADVSLAWDSPVVNTDGSPLADLSGYRIYHGVASGVYSTYLAVSNTPAATVSNLRAGCTNYFVVTAVNRDGVESGYSEEVAHYVLSEILISTNSLVIAEGSSATFQVRLHEPPPGMTTVLVSRVSGENCYLGVVSGSALVFSPSNWMYHQTVTIAALYDPAKTNRTADFMLAGKGLLSATIRLSAGGGVQGITEAVDENDSDANGIPDVWEIIQFGGVGIQGGAALDDPDHDGASNAQEYIAGTEPSDPASRPLVHLQVSDGRVEVSFFAREAEGAGYRGKTRFYTLQRCLNLFGGIWENVPEGTDIMAHNQTFSYAEITPAMRDCFYRLKVRL